MEAEVSISTYSSNVCACQLMGRFIPGCAWRWEGWVVRCLKAMLLVSGSDLPGHVDTPSLP